MGNTFKDYRKELYYQLNNYLIECMVDNKIIKISNILYQLKSNNKYWQRDKKYPLIKLISKLRKT